MRGWAVCGVFGLLWALEPGLFMLVRRRRSGGVGVALLGGQGCGGCGVAWRGALVGALMMKV